MLREAEQLKRIIAEEARRRMLAGKATDPLATLPEGPREAQQTRAQVADAVGMKPRTFAKVEDIYHAAAGALALVQRCTRAFLRRGASPPLRAARADPGASGDARGVSPRRGGGA